MRLCLLTGDECGSESDRRECPCTECQTYRFERIVDGDDMRQLERTLAGRLSSGRSTRGKVLVQGWRLEYEIASPSRLASFAATLWPPGRASNLSDYVALGRIVAVTGAPSSVFPDQIAPQLTGIGRASEREIVRWRHEPRKPGEASMGGIGRGIH